MRNVLSDAMTNSALKSSEFIVLTGDHGYALFDQIRHKCPDQFLNVGMIEQAMIGIAAGLCKVGFSPMVYGLSCFVPIRVVEQIKLDICYSNLPVKIIGDGAGLVYSTLGNSHQCGEDIACLRTLPNMQIYSPGDPEEMRICYLESVKENTPTYLRVGKSDNSKINLSPLTTTMPYFTTKGDNKKTCFISTGPMLGITNKLAKKNNISHISVVKLHPISETIIDLIHPFEHIIFFEEHVRCGGLTSIVTELLIDKKVPLPKIDHFCLKPRFSQMCGTYQYALSEHGLSDNQLAEQILNII